MRHGPRIALLVALLAGVAGAAASGGGDEDHDGEGGRHTDTIGGLSDYAEPVVILVLILVVMSLGFELLFHGAWPRRRGGRWD